MAESQKHGIAKEGLLDPSGSEIPQKAAVHSIMGDFPVHGDVVRTVQ